jgi:hypothetical protein
MGKNLIIRRGGGVSLAKYNSLLNAKTITDGLLAYSNLILSAEHANDLDNGQSFGFDNVNAVQYKALHGTYSESVIVNPSASATTLILNTTVGLVVGQEYTLQDGSNRENVIITSIDSGTVVTVPAITNSYTSAYLYDYYVGNPVGVVNYDFRADVLANGTTQKAYDFNGTTSKAIGTGTGFTPKTYFIDFEIKSASAENPLIGLNGNANNFIVDSDGGNGIFYRSSATDQAQTNTPKLGIGKHKIIIQSIGTNNTKIITNGVNRSLVENTADNLLVTSISLGFRETNVFGNISIIKAIVTSISITEQNAIDITDGSIDVDTLMDESNSDVYFDPAQGFNNLGTGTGFDLTPTDVTIIDGGIVAPFTPMDLITQSYTLTNASGATLQHFAKFGTGSYNLMTETSTDHFALSNATEEDNIKIKTTVVGDTGQLLDIQLELGSVTDL